MSYTRRFSKTISVRYSGSVSYPASEHGGSVSYSGTTTERIDFDVTVDTVPFDSAIDDMKGGVDLLTGSVVATEAAHVKNIHDTTRKIGDTIVSGFFKTVKSDISQQVAQLKIRCESLLLQMNQLAQRCRDKQRQMGVDYQRIADRYIKIFNDLSRELENRIYSIDEPVFNAARSLDATASPKGTESSVATVSVSAGENARVHSILLANQTKRRGLEAIVKAKDFLTVQNATNVVISKCLLPRDVNGTLETPYCVVETTSGPGTSNRNLYASPLLAGVGEETLNSGIDEKGWDARIPEEDVNGISDYFNRAAGELMQEADTLHAKRVAEMTTRLFNLSHTSAPGK